MGELEEAISEVERFLDVRQTMRGIEHEDIMGVEGGSPREAHLYQRHLRKLIDAARRLVLVDSDEWGPLLDPPTPAQAAALGLLDPTEKVQYSNRCPQCGKPFSDHGGVMLECPEGASVA